MVHMTSNDLKSIEFYELLIGFILSFIFPIFYLFRENSGKQKEIGSLESQVYRLVELVGVSLWVTLNCV